MCAQSRIHLLSMILHGSSDLDREKHLLTMMDAAETIAPEQEERLGEGEKIGKERR